MPVVHRRGEVFLLLAPRHPDQDLSLVKRDLAKVLLADIDATEPRIDLSALTEQDRRRLRSLLSKRAGRR